MYEIGILAALLNIFINYILGKPSGQFSPHEIFSSYTIWLSKRRLKKMNLYKDYVDQYDEMLASTYRVSSRQSAINDFNVMLYQAAEPFFTWERALGMCVVCTGVWVSLIFGLLFTQNFLDLLIIILISHILIRLLNKII